MHLKRRAASEHGVRRHGLGVHLTRRAASEHGVRRHGLGVHLTRRAASEHGVGRHGLGAPPSSPRAVVAAVGVAAAVAAAAGAWAPATYGARTTADEPQYLLSAISLAEDGDLDIADELAAERWRAFHAADLPEQTRPLPGGRRISPHDPLLPLLLVPGVALGGWLGPS